jgi:formylglycine-generating enzyme required for sulfatase activity
MLNSIRLLAVACGLLLSRASSVLAEAPSTWIGANDPAARFRGAPTYDLLVTNVSWKIVNKDYTEVTFDLSWSGSWRAKWTEPAETSITHKPIEVENWDAAWVFVKFLPEKDSIKSIERNHWQHATLAPDPSLHVMPAGATNSLRVSEDGSRGIGMFIFRDAIGHGANSFKGVKLRWQHGADKVDPTQAAVKVHPIAMVYVPEGPCKVGSGYPTGINRFSDGPDMPLNRHDWEAAMKLPDGSWTKQDWGSLTEGSWRGGPSIPFLVDAEWSGPVQEGTRARRIGVLPGQLWATHTHAEQFHDAIPRLSSGTTLNDDYPTGYDAVYCMKYDITQGQYTDFLNSLPPDVAAGRAFCAKPPPPKVVKVLFEGKKTILVDAEPASELGASEGTGSRHENEIKFDRPGYNPYTITEIGGLTITSPKTDEPLKIPTASGSDGAEKRDILAGDEPKDAIIDAFVKDVTTSDKDKDEAKIARPPVFAVRCPFRRGAVAGEDAQAFAVWAGLRQMTQLEQSKLVYGPREAARPYCFDLSTNKPPSPETIAFLDIGLPTERYANGETNNYPISYLLTRVGIRATADSDQAAAGATYWGILDLKVGDPSGSEATVLVHQQYLDFHSHGDGHMPAGKPGGSIKRKKEPFKEKPADWPDVWTYSGYRNASTSMRLVASAPAPKLRRDASATNRMVAAKAPPAKPPASSPEDTTRADTIQVTNIKWEAGTKEYSTVTFDLSWNNSWRAKWTEPAEKNVTGKPLQVESWDAAWVFVKFRPFEERVFSHASLDLDAARHQKPAGATLEVAANDDGLKGLGVFIYRDAIGNGANHFKGVKLRWQHPASSPDKSGNDAGTSPAEFDPAKAELSVHAIAMVYVPEGPFHYKGGWENHQLADGHTHPLTLINNPDPTQPGGRPGLGTNADPVVVTNTTPACETYPNGYRPFYIMKYSITQGEYARFLTEQAPNLEEAHYNDGRYGALKYDDARRFADHYGLLGYTISFIPGEGRYEAEVPDRPANLLSLPDIQSFMCCAGLRPPSDLEYDKSCRGPRAVARAEEAWAPGTCAPAAGLPSFVSGQMRKDVLPERRAFWPGASYWGIQDLSMSGCVHEWPFVANNNPVRMGYAAEPAGMWRKYNGSHGSGSPEVPDATWEWTAWGEWYERSYGQWTYQGRDHCIAYWSPANEFSKLMGGLWDRTGRYGARAARNPPIKVDPSSPLELDQPPDLRGNDIAIFDLTGRYNNTNDKPLKVELKTALPDACFPDGTASRVFTAAPKAVTPFRILTALTIQSPTCAVRRVNWLPVQILDSDGQVLAKRDVQLLIDKPENRLADGAPKQSVDSLVGGELIVRITNATARPQALTLNLPPPPGVKMSESSRNVSLAAHELAKVSYQFPRQAFPDKKVSRIFKYYRYWDDWACQMPYHVAFSKGATLEGETVVVLQARSRWWWFRRDTAEVRFDDATGDENALSAFTQDMTYEYGSVFKADAPPKGWKPVVFDAAPLQVHAGGSTYTYFEYRGIRITGMLQRGAKVVAATRFEAPRDQDVTIVVLHSVGMTKKPIVQFANRVWINDTLVYRTPIGEAAYGASQLAAHRSIEAAQGYGVKDERNLELMPCHIRKSGNTMVVEVKQDDCPANSGGHLIFQFLDAKDGKLVEGLIFDVDKK